MARMLRIQVVMDPALDIRIEREAYLRGVSKSAVIRQCVAAQLPDKVEDNGLRTMPTFDGEPVDDIDAFLYGPFDDDA